MGYETANNFIQYISSHTITVRCLKNDHFALFNRAYLPGFHNNIVRVLEMYRNESFCYSITYHFSLAFLHYMRIHEHPKVTSIEHAGFRNGGSNFHLPSPLRYFYFIFLLFHTPLLSPPPPCPSGFHRPNQKSIFIKYKAPRL